MPVADQWVGRGWCARLGRAGVTSAQPVSCIARQAWQCALANRDQDGALPSGGAIARAHGRQEQWGRLVKNAGLAGAFGTDNGQIPRHVADVGRSGASSSP